MELLIQEPRLQRDAQLRHFEALDTRAGIVLGFAGAIATFSTIGGLLGIAGRAAALISAMFALASFVPRDFPLFRAPVLLHALVGDESVPTEERHVEVLGWSIERAGGLLRSKSRALALAVTSVGSAAVILGSAIILHGGSS